MCSKRSCYGNGVSVSCEDVLLIRLVAGAGDDQPREYK